VSVNSTSRPDPAEAPDVVRPNDKSRYGRRRGATFVLADGALYDGGSLSAYCAVMGAIARRFPAALRRPGPLRDIAVAGATALGGVGLVLGDPRKFGHLPGVPWWALVGVQLLSAACLLARERAPLTVALAVAASSVVAATPAAAVATYAVFAYGVPVRRAWLVTFAMAGVTARPWMLDVSRSRDGGFTVDLQLMLVAVVIAAALGVRRRLATVRSTPSRRALTSGRCWPPRCTT
jgi:hypothetical protein